MDLDSSMATEAKIVIRKVIATVTINPEIMKWSKERKERIIKAADFADIGIRKSMSYDKAVILACEPSDDGWFKALIEVELDEDKPCRS